MEFTLKDLIYISLYVASVAGLIVRIQFGIKNLSDGIRSIKNIIFKERGGLNVVIKEDCEKNQSSLRQHSQDALDQISTIHENITIIMLDRGLKPIPLKPKTITKS